MTLIFLKVELMEDSVDSLKVIGVSFGNFGLSLTGIHTVLQCIVAVVSICYLLYKMKKMKNG